MFAGLFKSLLQIGQARQLTVPFLPQHLDIRLAHFPPQFDLGRKLFIQQRHIGDNCEQPRDVHAQRHLDFAAGGQIAVDLVGCDLKRADEDVAIRQPAVAFHDRNLHHAARLALPQPHRGSIGSRVLGRQALPLVEMDADLVV